MKVLAKILATSDYGYFDFWAGIEKWTYERTIDIARDAELKEYANDAEKEQGARIIRGIWNLMQSIPAVKFAIDADALDKTEEAFMEVALRPIFENNGNGWIPKDKLIAVALKEHPEFVHLKDPERRLRSLAYKKALYKENRPDTVYYRMNPYAPKKEIVA